MIKFIHKKHFNREEKEDKLVIYYNASDIFLGVILLILVVFFIHDYLLHALHPNLSCDTSASQFYGGGPALIPTIKR